LGVGVQGHTTGSLPSRPPSTTPPRPSTTTSPPLSSLPPPSPPPPPSPSSPSPLSSPPSVEFRKEFRCFSFKGYPRQWWVSEAAALKAIADPFARQVRINRLFNSVKGHRRPLCAAGV
jgi:hypothetical protein